MTSQIKFYRKNHLDLQRPNASITITDSVAINTGQASVDQMRNRNNVTGWQTTGSDDSANTIILGEFGGDLLPLDNVLLVKHNFQDFLIEWLDVGAVWNTFENVTGNTKGTTLHTLDAPVSARAVRVTVYNTQIADQDKTMRQFICTDLQYSFEGWPEIRKPTLDRMRVKNRMPSGRVNIAKVRGAFQCELRVRLTSIENDLEIHQNLYERNEGLLMLVSGGDEDQFVSPVQNYRNEDIALVLPSDEYTNPFYKGVYSNGIQVKIPLVEVDR